MLLPLDRSTVESRERGKPMEKEKTAAPSEASPCPRFPLPVALYESNGVIFELYRGGRRYEPIVILWERLKTVTITRHEGVFDVDINQGRRKLQQ